MRLLRQLRARFSRPEPAPPPGPRYEIFFLNPRIGLRSTYAAAACAGGPDATCYLLDYNYIDRDRSRDCLRALEAERRAAGLDFSGKTLLLAAKGLHPFAAELFELVREFAVHHVFVELWNGVREVVELASAGLERLYYLPVAPRLRSAVEDRVAIAPNRRVFVSLGGDDDLDLIRRVIAACPTLEFFVPTVTWSKAGSSKRFVDVAMDAANATPVDCSLVQQVQDVLFTDAYRAAFDACDTVLIATQRDRMFQMRGGVRFADALHARKQIVATENAPAQLLMAQHERTCLVATHDPEDVTRQVTRIATGGFQVDVPLYEAVRRLTDEQEKLAWMAAAAADPDAARRSPFARHDDPVGSARRALFADGRALLEREVGAFARDRAETRERAHARRAT